MKSNQKHSRYKKGVAKNRKGLAEKDVKSNGKSRPPGFDRFESFGYDELIAKHCYFRSSKPPDVDEIKIFDKDHQAIKHCSFILMLCHGDLYQKL